MAADAAGDLGAVAAWARTFAGCEAAEASKLGNGVALSLVFAEVSGEAAGLDVTGDLGESNWALGAGRLRRLLRRAAEWYAVEVGRDVSALADDVDAEGAAKGDAASSCRAAELVLGAAVQCARKQRYIGAIMSLDDASQAALMVVVERAMQAVSASPAASGDARAASPRARAESGDGDDARAPRRDARARSRRSRTPRRRGGGAGAKRCAAAEAARDELAAELEEARGERAAAVAQAERAKERLAGTRGRSASRRPTAPSRAARRRGATTSRVFGESAAQLRAKVARLERENQRLEAAAAAPRRAPAGAARRRAAPPRGSRASSGTSKRPSRRASATPSTPAPRPPTPRPTRAASTSAPRNAPDLDDAGARSRRAAPAVSAAPPETSAAPPPPAADDRAAVLAERDATIAKLQADREKLETYTRKTLHNVQEKYSVLVQTYKNQIKEKQDKITNLEARVRTDRTAHKREEGLVVSAIYDLGQRVIEANLAALHNPADGADPRDFKPPGATTPRGV
ncbi:hypothetical protein SO694_00178040 [Aureococcus anophagefferens]|uniref:HOOK N-terminal domain-containing protein n=1 Tax=Aureococcus anophagefferens TaxID=44056 RepID=A0ABR1FZV7_AURAN